MIKNVLVICFAGISLCASEKKPKDIYTFKELHTEIGRALKEYKENRDTMRNDFINRNKRVNFDPSVQGDTKADQQK